MNKITRMVMISFFTAFISIITFVLPSIPIGSISITLQTFVIMLAGALLQPLDAFISILLYIMLGVAGLPIFSNLQGGPSVLIGPTSGFIIAFPFAAYLISKFKGQGSIRRLFFVNIVIGIILIYIFGIITLSYVLKQSLYVSMGSMIIFLIPDVFKAGLAAAIGSRLKEIRIYNKKG